MRTNSLVYFKYVAVFLITVVLFGKQCFAAELKVLKTGLGSGTVTSSPAGINCGTDCNENFGSVSVTLTATEDTGSDFAGWDVDPNADPATVADCMGTSNTCTLSLSTARSVRPRFDLDPAIPEITDFTPEGSDGMGGIKRYLSDNLSVNSAARFVAALPDEYKQNWILMTRSESLQTGVAAAPRMLLPSADATSVFTLGMIGHSAYPGSHPDAIEYMQWDPTEKNFRFHEIVVKDIPELDYDSDGVGVIPARTRGISIDEPRCTRCHTTRNVLNPGTTAGTTGITPGLVKAKNKPNWDTYDSWGGMSPFNRDRIYQGSLEAATIRKFFNPWTWQTNDFIRSIIEQLYLQPPGVSATNTITRLQGGVNDGHIKFAFDSSSPVVTEPAPSGTSTTNINYSFDGVAGTGAGTTIQQGGSFVILQNPDTPVSSEGRGVQLFDLLGGADGSLNAQRIADEVIDHTYATGSVPIDVRAIALAITKLDRCVIVNAGTNTVTSNTGLPALNAGALAFFNARHGLSINELVDDTRLRAQSMPIRKANIQKLNLDRSGDVYLDSADPTNGLIQEYGAATSQGTSTAVGRIRQEVFRRPIDAGSGDSTVMGGKYVDRELYGVRIERTALYRYFLEPLGVSVDKWSMGVRGRSRTYTFADVFSYYRSVLDARWTDSLNTDKPAGVMNPTTWSANNCADLIEAVNIMLATLPVADDIPTYTDIQRVFNKGCIECHGGLDYPPYGNYGNFLDFSEDDNPPAGSDRLDRSHSIAMPLAGFLYQRITDDGRLINSTDPAKTVPYDPAVVNESCPNFTGLMPCGGPPLSQADILTVRRWINGSTPNTRGDPHIETIDDVHYDFQGAGEYVLLRGQNFEVQARQTAVETNAPLGPNDHTGLTSCVSLNSAAAVKVGPHRITYQPNLNGEPDPDGLQLRVDGELVQLGTQPIPLASGGRIVQTSAEGGIQIEAPGGTVVIITPRWWEHYQVWFLNIDASHVRATRGIMGAIAPGNWLPALPDGSFMGPRPKSLQQRYKDLYGKFGDAWRVTDASTLFDYAPGTSTATFTIASWPNGESPQSCELPPNPPGITPAPPLALLPLEVAEQHCSKVVSDAARHNCVQDVMVTGEPGFALSYLASERIEFNKPPSAPVLVTPEDQQTGLEKPVTFTWNSAFDQDNDSVSYRHCVWLKGESPDNNKCEVVSTGTTLTGAGFSCTWWVLLIGLLLLVILYFMGLKRKPLLLVLIAIVILIAVIIAFYLCGGKTITTNVSELESGKAYYWKVIAEDGEGNSTESKIRYFETR